MPVTKPADGNAPNTHVQLPTCKSPATIVIVNAPHHDEDVRMTDATQDAKDIDVADTSRHGLRLFTIMVQGLVEVLPQCIKGSSMGGIG